MIGLLTSLGIGELAISLITLFDLVEQRSLGSIVIGTELFCALEHQMLQIVSQTCCL